jgi:hypothetical protein
VAADIQTLSLSPKDAAERRRQWQMIPPPAMSSGIKPAQEPQKSEGLDEQEGGGAPVVVDVQGPLTSAEAAHAVEPVGSQCDQGHDLTKFITLHDGFGCNGSCSSAVSQAEFPKGSILFGCRACDFDLCSGCNLAPAPTLPNEADLKEAALAIATYTKMSQRATTVYGLLSGWVCVDRNY